MPNSNGQRFAYIARSEKYREDLVQRFHFCLMRFREEDNEYYSVDNDGSAVENPDGSRSYSGITVTNLGYADDGFKVYKVEVECEVSEESIATKECFGNIFCSEVDNGKLRVKILLRRDNGGEDEDVIEFDEMPIENPMKP